MGYNSGPQKLLEQQTTQQPNLTPRIVNKILEHTPNLQYIHAELYDILVQAQESDEPEAFYAWAYAKDPVYIRNAYNTFKNTDSIDLQEIFMTIDAKKRQYGSYFAILEAAGKSGGKIIGTWDDIKENIKGFFSESIIESHDAKVADFGKDNIYELFISVYPDGLKLVFSVHHDKSNDGGIDEAEEDIKAYRYFTELKFENTDHMIRFIREWANSYDTDLQDLIIFE